MSAAIARRSAMILRQRLCRAQLVPGHPPFRSRVRPEVDQDLERRASLLQLAGHLEVRAVGDERAGAAVVDDEFQLGNGEPVVEIVEHHPRRGNADPTLQMPEVVLADDGDHVAGAQAEISQATREAAHPASPLRVGQARLAVDDRLTVRTQRHRTRHWPRQDSLVRHCSPITMSSTTAHSRPLRSTVSREGARAACGRCSRCGTRRASAAPARRCARTAPRCRGRRSASG